jgi:hypothetical protein
VVVVWECSRVKEALLGEVVHERSKGTTLLQGKQGALLLIARGGLREHYYVQEWCCKQSETMGGVGLQEEQSEATKRMVLWEKGCWNKFARALSFLFLRSCKSSPYFYFLTKLQKKTTTNNRCHLFFLTIIHKKMTTTMSIVIIFCFFFLLCSKRRW